MQFRKFFSADSERSVRPRQRLGSEYIEGRGLYPERRDNIADRSRPAVQYDEQYDVQYEDRENRHGGHNGNWDSDRRVTRRRMPLTTLGALVQIKANGLTLENA